MKLPIVIDNKLIKKMHIYKNKHNFVLYLLPSRHLIDVIVIIGKNINSNKNKFIF